LYFKRIVTIYIFFIWRMERPFRHNITWRKICICIFLHFLVPTCRGRGRGGLPFQILNCFIFHQYLWLCVWNNKLLTWYFGYWPSSESLNLCFWLLLPLMVNLCLPSTLPARHIEPTPCCKIWHARFCNPPLPLVGKFSSPPTHQKHRKGSE
jgi:hypothetical protein